MSSNLLLSKFMESHDRRKFQKCNKKQKSYSSVYFTDIKLQIFVFVVLTHGMIFRKLN